MPGGFRGDGLGDHELTQGLKMAATAVISAVAVAALVITVGDAVLARVDRADDAPSAPMIVRTGG